MSRLKRRLAYDAGLFFVLFGLISWQLQNQDALSGSVVLAGVSTVLIGLMIAFATGLYGSDVALGMRVLNRMFVALVLCIPFLLVVWMLADIGGLTARAMAIGLPVGLLVVAALRVAPGAITAPKAPRQAMVIAPSRVLRPFGNAELIGSTTARLDTTITPERDGTLDASAVGRIDAFARLHRSDGVIAISSDVRCEDAVANALIDAARHGCATESLNFFLGREFGRLSLEESDTPAQLIYAQRRRSILVRAAERAIDIGAALVLLTLSAPVLAGIWLAIWLEDRGPILFRQARVGLDGKTFTVLKFRTMRCDAEIGGRAQWAQLRDPRVTRIGAFLRAHRLDEFPQLLNVLNGEMSLVGPRPERPELVAELARRIPYYNLRHKARPGLTGWAQINFPYGASVEDAAQKLRFDLYYVKRRSPVMNVFILLQTVRVVLFAEGAR